MELCGNSSGFDSFEEGGWAFKEGVRERKRERREMRIKMKKINEKMIGFFFFVVLLLNYLFFTLSLSQVFPTSHWERLIVGMILQREMKI